MDTQQQDIAVMGPLSNPRQAGIYVRQTREDRDLTRAQLAKAAGVSERLIASLELGDATGIRLDKLLAVLDALGIKLTAQLTSDVAPVTASTTRFADSDPSSYNDLMADILREQGIDATTLNEVDHGTH